MQNYPQGYWLASDIDPAMNQTLVASTIAALALLVAAPPVQSTHADGSYDLPNWYLPPVPLFLGFVTVDVLILPAEHGQVFNGNGAAGGNAVAEAQPCANSYTAAMRDSTVAWRTAIQNMGAAWIKNNLILNVYVVGCDSNIPTAALTHPEVVVFTDENKGPILGVAFSSTPCLVDNSKFFITSFTYNDMYNINSQEFGHCLGLDHVSGSHPVNDVMNGSYPYTTGAAATPKNCVSNLDVLGVQSSFAFQFGQPGAGQTATIAVGAYAQQTC